ncbi:U-box domain-containing protein 51-like [Cynara cardunculus var. scolymus]|uniref:U-box domain-containing protein 51-like n=1 Tax=Cynara cardunculus var. scolymus TaxID=59895 RepID=UPI000D62615B|nr:U-box domain-containing protein 51-like [Cynara cardunculus var. scolymus]
MPPQKMDPLQLDGSKYAKRIKRKMDETERPRPKGAKPIKKSKISRNPLLKESKNESGKWEWQMKASILQCAYDSRSLAKLQVQRKSSQFHLIGRIIRIKIRWVFMFTEGRMNNKVIGVAIDKDKGSQSALKWTADNLLGKGQIVYLLHVKIKHSVPFSSSVSFAQKPNKMSDLHPDDSLMIDADSQLRELFLPFRCFCTRKEIKSHEVVLEDTDVVKALVEFVTRSIIEVLVIGAPAKGGLLKRFKTKHIPGSILKGMPNFCTVYVISKGRILATKASSRPPPYISPLRTHSSPRSSNRSSNASSENVLPIGAKALPWRPANDSGFTRQFPYSPYNSWSNDSSIMKSPFNNRRGPNGKPYGELTPPESDISFVSSGRPSVDNFNMFPSFDSEMNARISFSELEQDSYQMGRRSADINTSPDLTSFDSPRASLSSNAEDVEAEMRRLKLELTKTMEMYSSACKEALTAKQKAMELQRWKLEEQQKVEEARVAEESVEKEKAKTKTATEAAEAAQRIAELESQKRVVAEKSALRESSENNAGLMSFSRYRRYTIDEIEEATEYFSATRRIGEGGYGPVYKCHLDHTPVAVKVLRPDAAQGRLQFQQEVEVLCCIRHPHMVLLLGACPEYGCLVYEYMSNGSLEDCLLRKNKIPPLSWQHRFRITAEICSGLLFLHQTKPEPIVHRDLKPANILLDRNFVSKIADVGLARLVPASVQDSVTQYRMTSAAGTFCYIDPEYQQTGMLGVKSDVYSLGVMFLQIITAKPPMALTHHVDRAIKNGTFAEMLDPAVPDWPVEEALGLAKLSLHCAELRRKDRPDLGKIVMPELERLRTLADESVQYSIFSPASQVS